MKISEIDYADSIPELNISDLSSATQVGQVDNKAVWVLNDGNYYIIFFKDDADRMTAYIAITITDHDGFVDLVRLHNKSPIKGVITALLHFARGKGFKFCIPNNEPLTKEGFKWLEKLILSGGRGFKITDQSGQPPDLTTLKKEWINAKRSGISGPTSIFIESRNGSNIGNTLLEKYPSKWLKPAIRFIGDTSID